MKQEKKTAYFRVEYLVGGAVYATKELKTMAEAKKLAAKAKTNKTAQRIEIIGYSKDGFQTVNQLVYCAECKSPVPHYPSTDRCKAQGKVHCTCDSCF